MRTAGSGNPQGGVLSSLLPNLVITELLKMLERDRCRAVAYVDDLVLTVSGKFTNIIRDRMQLALKK